MIKIFHLLIFLQILLFDLTFAAESEIIPPDTVHACRLNGQIILDGILSEKIWQGDKSISNFVQREPIEGSRPTFETVVHVAYDDEALYIGARLFDTAPDSIISRLSRRDQGLDSDAFGIFIDPYLDRRSGYYFGLTAAGTYFDGVMLNDEWDDDSWDGVWQGKVNVDQYGWSLEIKIPYSQLRFHQQEKYTWGINFRRDIKRLNEQVYLVFTPKDGSGFVSRFPVLSGIEKISPSRRMEVLPYVRAKAEYLDVEPGDPFNDGSRLIPGIGADFKQGIGNNLTLDGTINPDFGQVEVDPAVVNLTDVETYFQEKRPFFIEGASTFHFGEGGSRENWSFNFGPPTFFYSRRIGRAPQGSLPDNDYADVPEGTRILGAAKLTGKMWKNWNVGTLHAVTAREYADIDNQGEKSRSEIEPLSYYGILRSQREIDKGHQGIGFIGTYVGRNFNDPRLRTELNSHAASFGIDGWSFLDKEQIWVVTGWTGMSHIQGSRERILDVQTNSQHYLQRPDAGHVQVDSNATSMTGYAGRILINKQKGNTFFNAALGFIDPKFDVNDAGFFYRGDVINGHIGSGYKWTEPGTFAREAHLIGALFGSIDFGKNITWAGIFTVANIKFLNYYGTEIMYAYNPPTLDNRLTRGGPLVLPPAGWELNISAQSDDRKPLTIRVFTNGYTRSVNEWFRDVGFSIEWRPVPNFMLSLGPQIMWDTEFAQWVNVFPDPTAAHTYGNRYVFGEMDYTEFSASVRVNWTFTPNLSLQLYAQPLASKAEFTNFKELAKPKTYDFNRYGDGSSTIEKVDGSYTVDPDGSGPAQSFTFDDPNFNIRSLRINAVLRWEYMPGSALYLVWTQNRFNDHYQNDFQLNSAMTSLWDQTADNIIMAKLTYWMHL